MISKKGEWGDMSPSKNKYLSQDYMRFQNLVFPNTWN